MPAGRPFRLLIVLLTLLLPFAARAETPQESANRLAVEAKLLTEKADGADGDTARIELLRQAQAKLDQILVAFPGTDMAVKIAGGEKVAGLTRGELAEQIGRLSSPNPAATTGWRQFARFTANTFETGIDWARDLAGYAATIPALLALIQAPDGGLFRWVGAEPAWAFGMTLIAYFLLYQAVTRLAPVTQRRRWVRVIAELVALIMALAVGYIVAFIWLGSPGSIAVVTVMVLNVFLLTEAIRLIARAILRPEAGAKRFLSLSDRAAAYLYRWLNRFVLVGGWGVLLLYGMASGNLPPSALAALRAILAVTLWAMAVTVVVQTRSPARRLIRGRQDPDSGDIATAWHALRRVAAKAWTPVAIAYLTVLLLVFLARETLTLPLIVRSAATMALLVAAAVVQDLLIRRLSRGIVLSDRSRERLPQLEERLNHFLAPVGLIARIALIVVVVAAFLQIWNILPISQWLTSSEGGRLIQTVFSIAVILAIALLVWIAFATWVEARLNPRGQTVAASQRLRTLLVLARNAVSITLSVLVAMVILSELGINIGPLLAGAGVVGLAVGFGAQSLVKDIINGAFLQFENALNTGDVVTAGGVSGVVERLTIRSVGLRDGSGTFHVIPFSAIDKVANMTRDFGYHVADIGVAYDTDIDHAMAVIGAVGEEMRTDPAWSMKIIDAPDLQGVIGFGESAVTIRARLKCRAGDHWAVGREFSRRLKRAFDTAGIEIPFPQRILHVRQGTPAGMPTPTGTVPTEE